MNQKIVDIYVLEKKLPPVISIQQGTNAISIAFDFKDYDIQSALDVRIYMKKPSGAEIYNKGEIIGNKAVFQTTTQMTAEAGRNIGQVQLTDSSKILNTFLFFCDIDENIISSDSIESTNEYAALDALIIEAREAVLNAEQEAGNAKTAAEMANNVAGTAAIAAGEAKSAAGTADRAAIEAKIAADAANQGASEVNSAVATASSAAQRVEEAADTADRAAVEANKAADAAIKAEEIAEDLIAKRDAGEFTGPQGANGVVTVIQGQVAFQVVNGDLIMYYDDNDTAPDYSIDANGDLILNIGGDL